MKSDACLAYERLLRQLHLMDRQGKLDTDESDVLREQMEEPWEACTDEEKAALRGLSCNLGAGTDVSQGEQVRAYAKLLYELEALERQGKDESVEGNRLREQMFDLWHPLTDEERGYLDEFSAELRTVSAEQLALLREEESDGHG